MFVSLILVASWARSAFKIDLDGKVFFGTLTALALIAGFGFNALRFRGFLSSRLDPGAGGD